MGGGGSRKKTQPLEIDFEGATGEGEVYEATAAVLERSGEILHALREYKGCGEVTRAAINKPSPESEAAAWEQVVPAVARLRDFFEYSSEVAKVFSSLLNSLSRGNPRQNLQTQQGLTKLFANCVDFVIQFDEAKMVNPAIQNDFSYYRRTLNRMKRNGQDLEDNPINDELANRMSLFFAYPNPMMKVLVEAISKAEDIPKNNITRTLSILANSCSSYCDKNGNVAYLRAMTGLIVLYDNVDNLGAFHKKSSVAIADCIRSLKKASEDTSNLQNALRFSTVSYNKDTTPKKYRALLDG